MRLDAHQREPFAPSSLRDPVAQTTEWTPCKRGGSNFCTHKLASKGPGRVAFRPTFGACIFYSVFLLLGGSIVVAGLRGLASGNAANPGSIVGGILVGLVFAGPGAAMLWFGTRPIVFDRTVGMFWKGWGTPQQGAAAIVDLGSIHALQVISEYCAGKHSFYSYELNLVLADGSRINVVDHGDLGRVRSDAGKLAQFLDVPLWDPV